MCYIHSSTTNKQRSKLQKHILYTQLYSKLKHWQTKQQNQNSGLQQTESRRW